MHQSPCIKQQRDAILFSNHLPPFPLPQFLSTMYHRSTSIQENRKVRIKSKIRIEKQFFFPHRFLLIPFYSSGSEREEKLIRTSSVARLARDESGRVCGTSPGNTLSCETDNFPAPPLSFTNESSIVPVLLRNTLWKKESRVFDYSPHPSLSTFSVSVETARR